MKPSIEKWYCDNCFWEWEIISSDETEICPKCTSNETKRYEKDEPVTIIDNGTVVYYIDAKDV